MPKSRSGLLKRFPRVMLLLPIITIFLSDGLLFFIFFATLMMGSVGGRGGRERLVAEVIGRITGRLYFLVIFNFQLSGEMSWDNNNINYQMSKTRIHLIGLESILSPCSIRCMSWVVADHVLYFFPTIWQVTKIVYRYIRLKLSYRQRRRWKLTVIAEWGA